MRIDAGIIVGLYLLLSLAPCLSSQVTGSTPGSAASAASDETKDRFEVASIRQADLKGRGAIGLFVYPGGRVGASYCTLPMLIMYAYNIQLSDIAGGPKWAETERFTINAIPPADSASRRFNPKSENFPPTDEQRRMLASLLRDRFHLKIHFDKKPGTVYLLTKGKEPHLFLPQDKDGLPWVGGPQGESLSDGDGLGGSNATMALLAFVLTRYLEEPVIDETGLTGSYDFSFRYSEAGGSEDISSSIMTSLKGLGLELKRTRGTITTLVIDSAEQPTAN